MDLYKYFLDNHAGEPSRKMLVEMIGRLHEMINDYQHTELNHLLKVANQHTSIQNLIFLIRGTYVIRSHLPEWQTLLDNSVEWIRQKGEDPKTILVCLI